MRGCCRRRGGSWRAEGLAVTWRAQDMRDEVQSSVLQAEESEAWGTQAQ